MCDLTLSQIISFPLTKSIAGRELGYCLRNIPKMRFRKESSNFEIYLVKFDRLSISNRPKGMGPILPEGLQTDNLLHNHPESPRFNFIHA